MRGIKAWSIWNSDFLNNKKIREKFKDAAFLYFYKWLKISVEKEKDFKYG